MVLSLQVSLQLEKHKAKTSLLWARNDSDFVKLNGKRKAFFKGGNSSCRFHIRGHYEIYKERCEKAAIPINHWAIPRPIWKAMEEEKKEEKRGQMSNKERQQQLAFKTMTGPREFTREGVLDAVVKLIATNNLVNFFAWLRRRLSYHTPFLANCACGQPEILQCPCLDAAKINHIGPSNIVHCEKTPA